jgi:hypothetical protein
MRHKNISDRNDFKSGAVVGFSYDNADVYGGSNEPDNARPYRDPVPESLTSPRRIPAPSVRNGFNPPDVGAIVQKERQQVEYAEMLKQQMREREEAKAAAKQAKRIEEEAELDRAPPQPLKSFAKQKVSYTLHFCALSILLI